MVAQLANCILDLQMRRTQPAKFNALIVGRVSQFTTYLRRQDTVFHVLFGDGEPHIIEIEDWSTEDMVEDGWALLSNLVKHPEPVQSTTEDLDGIVSLE